MAQERKFLKDFPKVEILRIEGDLNNEFDNLRSGYNTQKSRRMQFYKEYKFQAYGNEQHGSSRYVDSTIFDAIEWMVPSIIQSFVETNDFLKVKPVSATVTNMIKAQLARELLNYQIRRKNDFYQFLYDIIKGFLIGGESFGKIVWTEKSKNNGESVDFPKIFAAPADQIRYDWTVKNFEDSSVVTQEEDLTRSEILDLFIKSDGVQTHQATIAQKSLKKGVIDFRFNQAIAEQGRNSKTGYLRDEQAEQRNWVGEMDQNNSDKNKGFYLRREHWTMYDMEGNGFMEPIMAVFIDDKLVQVQRNILPDKKPPFLRAECIRDVMGNPAMGWAELLSDIQKYQTGIMRMFSDNLNAQHNGIYEYDQTNVDQAAILLLQQAPPGSKVPLPVRKMGSIQAINPAPIASQAFSITEKLEISKENRSGFTRYSQGNDSNSLNQTATGITQIMNRSELRMWEMSMRFSEMFIKRLGRKVLALNQAFLPKQHLEIQFNVAAVELTSAHGGVAQIPGRKVGDWVVVSKNDIDGAFDLELDVQTKSAEQSQIDNNLNWAQFFGPYVQQGIIQPKVLKTIALETAKLMGNTAVEVVLREEIDHVGTGGILAPIAGETEAPGTGVDEAGAGAPPTLPGPVDESSLQGNPS